MLKSDGLFKPDFTMTPESKDWFASLKLFYSQHWKKLMWITIAMLIVSVAILGFNKVSTGEFVQKDVSLKGGLLITISSDKTYDLHELESALKEKLGTPVNVKSLKATGTNQLVGYSFELASEDQEKTIAAIEDVLQIELAEGDYTIEQVSSATGEALFRGLVRALIIAFVLMSVVVFIFFRVPAPSMAVILAAVSDIIETLAILALINFQLSTASIAALLLLIGYSVDTDILLSTRVLKRTSSTVDEAIFSAVKTGMTMQVAAIISLVVLLLVSPAPTLKNIATILIIGLTVDIFNTWIQNTGLLKLYLEYKESHGKA